MTPTCGEVGARGSSWIGGTSPSFVERGCALPRCRGSASQETSNRDTDHLHATHPRSIDPLWLDRRSRRSSGWVALVLAVMGQDAGQDMERGLADQVADVAQGTAVYVRSAHASARGSNRASASASSAACAPASSAACASPSAVASDVAFAAGFREQPVALESDVIPLRELERRAIAHALQATLGNVGRAARLLGIGRATLYRRLAEPGAKLRASRSKPAD